MNFKKIIFQSLGGGILIPFLYLCAVAFISNLFDIFLPLFFRFPLLWAGFLYGYFYPNLDHFQMFSEFRGEVILANVIGNFLLYSFLTFLFLWWKEKRTNKLD